MFGLCLTHAHAKMSIPGSNVRCSDKKIIEFHNLTSDFKAINFEQNKQKKLMGQYDRF